MDTVYIHGLSVFTTIGVYDSERDIRQELNIDLNMSFNNSAAGKSDSVTDALDYDAVSKRTIEFVENSSYFLIEAVAENLAQLLLSEFPIERLQLKIGKPGALESADDVGVIIERVR
ncbi:MAG: dihydroneopterin aldolase [Gammaproteobacteria bacterium]|jgi:7,8-dihydroneopterin aldolase/epimerase/oxygenase|nr:dihydroneopterin aldolase [Gammaproteobacteria bacterium]MBT4493153.1 dihydroneopterin aldolase [Gammaproteobacteria bacterium]MBT7370667.1 dihydroneopterin aldolase [Gammaproteobacteria bacterium]